MKVLLILILMILTFENTYGSSRGDTEPVEVKEMSITFEEVDSPVMTIEFDGQIKINGKNVEHMSHPEIKAELKKIVAFLQENSVTDYLFRQTEMLLEEIGKLQAELEKCRDK